MKGSGLKNKEVLSNSFIKKMIKADQRVASSLGKKKEYNKTNYYKNLTTSQKRSFDRYMMDRGDIGSLFLVLFSLLLFSALFLNFGITGHVVDDVIGEEKASTLTAIVTIAFLFVLFFALVVLVFKKIKAGKFRKVSAFLDSVGMGKFFERRGGAE